MKQLQTLNNLESSTIRSFVIYTDHLNLLGSWNLG